MNVQTRNILDQARRLPPIERAELLEQLFSTFDKPVDPAVDEAWAKEAEDRLAAYRSGELSGSSAEEVFERINRKESER